MTDELIARLESGEGADRELDCRIHVIAIRQPGDTREMHTIFEPYYQPARHFFNPNPEINWNGYDLLNVAPEYTSSLDAALGLVRKMLPGCGVNIDIPADGRKNFGAHIGQSEEEWTYDGWPSVVGPSAPRAILVALLTSLKVRALAKEGANADG